MKTLFGTLALVICVTTTAAAQAPDKASFRSQSASFALKCVTQSEPFDSRTYGSDAQVHRGRHPSFYGCFDWHASVFNHWALVYFLKNEPTSPLAPDLIKVLNEHLAEASLATEMQNMSQDLQAPLYESAWLLTLIREVRSLQTPEGKVWSKNLEAIEKFTVQYFSADLQSRTKPNTSMLHMNTAYPMAHAWDYAVATGDQNLQTLIRAKADVFFGDKKNCDATDDTDDYYAGVVGVLPNCLSQADLMKRVLAPDEFNTWFQGFIVNVTDAIWTPQKPSGEFAPYKTGLLLSKAKILRSLASGFSDPDLANRARAAADVLEDTAEGWVFSFGYSYGEHWLPAFYLYAHSQ